MKVKNMTSDNGNTVANQFIISGFYCGKAGQLFQSYDSAIAFKPSCGSSVTLDRNYWDYSVTTGRYRNQFLGETKKETQAKIDSGEYLLADLNN